MEDSMISIIAIIIAAVIMFLVPMMLISDRVDDISQLSIQTNTAEFVNEVIKSGKITDAQYQKFVTRLYSTGNTYEIDMEVKVLDENTAKRETTGLTIGNNTTYSIFTSQVEDIISNDGALLLKQGDAISVTIKNSSRTISQSLKSFFFNTTSSDLQIVAATASGTIAINGRK